MKKLILSFVGVALFIVIVGLLTKANQGEQNILSFIIKTTPAPVALKKIKIGNKEISVRLADTPALRQKGLSGTASLGENEGVLFIFDQKDTQPSFWMKDMLIAIDIIWINDGRIVKIDKSVLPPAAGTKDRDLKLYSPGQKIDQVLEVNAGYCERNNIKVGDIISL